MSFEIVYSPEAIEHLRVLARDEQVTVLDQVEQQLVHQPNAPTRKRKFLRPNSIAAWQLRLGNLRVFYDIETDVTGEELDGTTRSRVIIKAVGVKRHNELWLGGEKVEL